MNNYMRANVVMPPQRFKPDGKFTIFLAGSIEMGKAVDWQLSTIETLRDYSVNILNPRRPDWDPSWVQSIHNPDFREQVEWELRCLSMSDLILMYLQPETMSPISMLELGLYANTGKLVVCCPNGFWRKGNIDIVCEHHRIVQCNDLREMKTFVQNRIRQGK